MDADTIGAIVGGVATAFAVRFFNVVLEWLAKALNVEPVEPIPTPGTDRGEASS